ncbi:YidH family protein [Qipengyuania sp. CAU 1752]
MSDSNENRRERRSNGGYDKGEGHVDEKNNTELAIDRTDMAEDRTIMAVERTFAGWIRTSFAAMAIGLGLRALFGELEPPWLAKAIATMFMLLAIWIALNASSRTCEALGKMREHAIHRPRQKQMRWIGYAVAAGAGLLIAGLWILNDGNIAKV